MSKSIKVGDYVEFKCDIEQCAEVIAVNGSRITVKAPDYGFDGEYINDQDTYILDRDDCWTD